MKIDYKSLKWIIKGVLKFEIRKLSFLDDTKIENGIIIKKFTYENNKKIIYGEIYFKGFIRQEIQDLDWYAEIWVHQKMEWLKKYLKNEKYFLHLPIKGYKLYKEIDKGEND